MVSNGGRTEENVIKCLKKLKHPERVEAVCSDMWKPYITAVQKALPNAAPVTDRFRVIKSAQESVNAARRSIQAPKKVKDAMKKAAA
ncbi:MAG: transposase, partial [Clostridiales bacterium]|nr:transposase [Clostridiales bacterium]